MNDELAIRHAQMEAEVRIAASPSTVWAAITTGVGDWWPHTFSDAPHRIALEPIIGGRFYEQFDAQGNGALYAHVTYIEPERMLRISGPMGMRGASLYVKTYRLQPFEGGTVVRTSAVLVGAVSEATIESYRVGGQGVLDALRDYLESASPPG